MFPNKMHVAFGTYQYCTVQVSSTVYNKATPIQSNYWIRNRNGVFFCEDHSKIIASINGKEFY